MAANTVAKGGIRKSAQKSSLANPFTTTWPTVENKTYRSIMNAIGRNFPSVLSQKTISKIKQNALFDTSCEPLSEADKKLKEQIMERRTLRKCLAVGINEVTKGLEKDELCLVLVDRSTKPSMMIDHLMLLGATRKIPTLGLHELGQLLGTLMHYKKAAAIGFKKQRPSISFDELIEYITSKVPDIVIPWLSPFKDRLDYSLPDFKDTDLGETSTLSLPEKEINDDNKEILVQSSGNDANSVVVLSKANTLKRKLSDSSDIQHSDSETVHKQKCRKGNENSKQMNDEIITVSSVSTGIPSKEVNVIDTKSNTKKRKMKKDNKEKPNSDLEIVNIACQTPIINTIQTGKNKDKKKKKKKKEKN